MLGRIGLKVYRSSIGILSLGMLLIASPLSGQTNGSRLVSASPPRTETGSALDEKVSLDVQSVSLKEALRRLMEAGAPLTYSLDLVHSIGPVSCKCVDVRLDSALKQLTQSTGIEFREVNTGDVLLYSMPKLELQAVREGGVSGRVTSAEDGDPLVGASVQIVDTQRRTVTQADGTYVISDLRAGRYWIRVDMVGFHSDSQSVAIVAGEVATLNFSLQLKPVELSPLEAHVTTGTLVETKRRALGTSISVISESQIEESGAKSLLELLTAAAPGVQAMSSNGVNGAGGHIQIRGTASFIQDQAPLVYVDGVPVDAGSSALNQRGITHVGTDHGAHIRLDELNLDQIERIEIIKGPSAATLYGSEAVNGVIQIFTKRGQAGPTRITVDVEQDLRKVRLDDTFVGTSPYANEIRKIFRDPNSQQYQFNISGGDRSLTYNAGAQYRRDDGIAINNAEEQTSIHASFGSITGGNFSIRLSGNFVQRSLNTRDYQQLFEFSDGVDNLLSDQFMYGFESLDEALREGRRTEMNLSRFYGSANLSWRPFDFWQQQFTFGVDQSTEENESIGKMWIYLGDGYERDRVTRTFDRWSARYVSTLSYPTSGRSISGPVSLDLSFGGEASRDESRRLRIRGMSLPSMDVTGFDHGQDLVGGDANMPTELYTAVMTVGGFAQLQFGWNDQLYITGGIRADGSSSFGDDFGLQAYPKIAASYVTQPAPWWTNKVRIAWGRSGKLPAPFAHELTYRFHKDYTTNLPVLSLNGAGNPLLKPEVGSEIEMGVENFFLDNRASLELNYFYQTTRDAILYDVISAATGFSMGPQANLGGLRSQGIEAQAQLSGLRVHNAARLSLGLSLTHMIENGVVTSLGDYEYLSTGNQPMAWGVLQGLKVGRSMRDLLVMSFFPDGERSQGFESMGSRTPTTYGGVNLNIDFTNGLRLYSGLSYSMGGYAMDHTRAQRDAAAGLVPGSEFGYDPEVARRRYVYSTDHARLNVVRLIYRLPQTLLKGRLNQAEIWGEGHNIATWHNAPTGDPTRYAVESTHNTFIQGAVGYVVPTPQRYTIGLRVAF